MAYEYSDLVARAQHWAEQAIADQRLDQEQAQAIMAVDARTPDNLFAQLDARPLIVAFMGGTGVGKSSLLNRLAGQAIAKTGIERPTSREVTLYHHHSVTIQQLPAGLPVDKVNISQHQDDSKSNIIWVDMPDFDSVELSNKQLVLDWLPHIDVLLYVVSPERYRDSKAWKLLLAEGARHAWLFVLNQWDRGQLSQYDDLKRQLAKAGFEDPLVFRTICNGSSEDEFDDLLTQLEALSTGHSVQELEQRGREVRIQQLSETLQPYRHLFVGQDYQQLKEHCRQQWQKTESLLGDGFNWPLRQLALAYAGKGGAKPDIKLWDDWAQSRLNDLLDDVIVKASQLQLPVKPLKQSLLPLRENADKIISTQTELACRQALIRPGNALQRFFIKLMRVSEFLLPLTAMGLVGYKVVTGFYQSALTGNHPYLGTNFAIHSVLLVVLSWLVPYFLHKKMQPSLEKAAIAGLRKGLEAAFVQIETQIKQALENEQQQHQQLNQQLNDILESCQKASKAKSMKHDPQLDRMLID
ncbi:GTPase [Methylomarinum sp. Ch1-1]|uniref:GTPase n=1 Tax=Methylomarinum roseum TaxID=3067653 RepID=A0AAU7NRQ6_9GAMM|nr:GTPase [Methylomarinum sp. Ch1-1]MDP4520360.1 GTPase [Methylomarinum sp. Ch1-1]